MSQKEKFALYLTPEMKARLERRYTDDGSRSLTGFIENAINFYLDYLSANNAGLFLPSSVQSYLDGRLNQFEDRMASLLYKQSVELDMGMSVLADCVKLDEAYLRKKRAESVASVKKFNGRLRLEQIVKCAQEQRDGDDLESKNYNDLVYETTMLPNILVLFVLPHDEQLWLNVDREHLSIRHCAWWCSLAGLAPTQNSESKRIRIPIEQVFDPSNLIKMMDNLKGGNRP